jgi:hypothetical protein
MFAAILRATNSASKYKKSDKNHRNAAEHSKYEKGNKFFNPRGTQNRLRTARGDRPTWCPAGMREFATRFIGPERPALYSL